MKESKFFEDVIAMGRAEGELMRARSAVLEALDVKFGTKAAAEFREAVQEIGDLDQLSDLLRLAIKSRGVSGFRRGLEAAGAAS